MGAPTPPPEPLRPLDRGSLLVEFAGRVSALVGFSSVFMGAVIGLHLTKFPALLYEAIPQRAWGIAFFAVGITHLYLLRQWFAGKPSPSLARVHLATACIAVPFTIGSVVGAFNDGTGFLVATLVFGGGVLAVLTSRLGIWRYPGASR